MGLDDKQLKLKAYMQSLCYLHDNAICRYTNIKLDISLPVQTVALLLEAQAQQVQICHTSYYVNSSHVLK